MSAERKKKSRIRAEGASKAETKEGSLTIDDDLESSVYSVQTPVDRLLSDLESKIDKLSRELRSKETALTSFSGVINIALERNDGNLTICGQCHLKEGHTKRNCQFGACLSAKACGQIERHPREEGERKKLESEIARLKKSLKKLQEDYKMKKATYSKISESYVHKVENDLISTNPNMYIENSCKNWALIHKHAVILEQKCKGKLPKRASIAKLIKSGNEVFDSSDTSGGSDEEGFVHGGISSGETSSRSSTFGNPAKAKLEQHGIKFPERKNTTESSSNSLSTSSTLYRCAPSNPQEEQEQLKMVINQSMLEQQVSSSCSNMTLPYIPVPAFTYYPPNLPIYATQYTSPTTVNSDVCHFAENQIQMSSSYVETLPYHQTLESGITFDKSPTANVENSTDIDNEDASRKESAADALVSLMEI